jgi:site-specific DNA-methyltransferase (adenine-specific)
MTPRVDVICGSADAAMSVLPVASAQLIVLDPPHDAWSTHVGLFDSALRILRDGYAIAFCHDAQLTDIRASATSAGFIEDACYVWHDPQPIFTSTYKPLRTHEFVPVFRCGTPERPNMKAGTVNRDQSPIAKGDSSLGRWRASGRVYTPGERKHLTSVLTFPRPLQGPLGRWQKPIELLECLIRAYTREGDTVLDPFGGSGAVSAAAIALGRSAVHIEVDPARIADARVHIGPLFCEVSA